MCGGREKNKFAPERIDNFLSFARKKRVEFRYSPHPPSSPGNFHFNPRSSGENINRISRQARSCTEIGKRICRIPNFVFCTNRSGFFISKFLSPRNRARRRCFFSFLTFRKIFLQTPTGQGSRLA